GALVLPQRLDPPVLDQQDRLGAAGPALRRIPFGAGPDERQRANSPWRAAHHRKRRVAAERRADEYELAVLLVQQRGCPVVERRSAPVQARSRDLVVSQRLELRFPHSLVERKCVQEHDFHRPSAIVSSSSAAIAGRSLNRSSQAASASKGSRSTPRFERARKIQGT